MGKLLFLILGLALGLLLARYLRGQRAGRDLSAPPRPMVRVGDERIDNEEIRALIRADRKIEAIKLVRERTGLGLAEAKDAIEALERTMR
ncbi:MAG: ribosomal protein L7/L12 [Sphingopyxis sp.]|uniref:ribosomal protein L7/L12 n=1 Tax=Sphingopyxis sp. TaxID=1908224 RepID=UPI001A4DA3D4|nr:ribosomal protein L7/L12 [Sphingopyxis sp.]MBL9067100.1 ribosomal protein L7/L12 [Sphingopyxis sp.]